MRCESTENRIRSLEDRLYQARRTIIEMMPPPVLAVAEAYHRIQTRSDAHEWLKKLVEATIEIAWPAAEQDPYFGATADCPLCRRGTLGPYDRGFLLPGGLRKHLLGEGNAHECHVLGASRALADQHWRPKVEKAEADERAAEEAVKRERRGVEEQFRTSPGRAAYLRDECLFGAQPRDDESLVWALNRLKQLGFVEVVEGRIRQFIRDFGDAVVFADPRQLGRLNFAVYRREQVDNPKSQRSWSPDHERFYLLDTWRKDIARKLEDRIETARMGLLQRQDVKEQEGMRPTRGLSTAIVQALASQGTSSTHARSQESGGG